MNRWWLSSAAPSAADRWYVDGPAQDEPLVWCEGWGSISAVTNGSGAALAINSYDEYGLPASGDLGRFQYTGQAWLPEVGLYHDKARAYSPSLGRFMQPDPIGYGDGMNFYAYVQNDPVNGWAPADWRGKAEVEIVVATGPFARKMCNARMPPSNLRWWGER